MMIILLLLLLLLLKYKLAICYTCVGFSLSYAVKGGHKLKVSKRRSV